jgi:cation diffusion facilitator CzcD-associated flavoprotein CzcO
MCRSDGGPIVIVGSGPSGLAAAGALAHRGLRPVVLERSESVGDGWRRRYDRLRLHTARAFSGLPHEAIPRRYTRYVAKDDYAAYLEWYAERLELDVHLETEVRRVAPNGHSWSVEAGAGTWDASAVVVATGRYAEPFVPDWAARHRFAGRLLHAAEFRSGAGLAGTRVLVVGLGNSGAEIAAEVAEHAAAVAVSVRSTPPIARRQIAGIPLQALGIALAPLPARSVDRAGALLRRLSVGDLTSYGLGEAAWGPFSARRPPVIDAGFLEALRGGKLRVVPAVARLTRDAALFVDGSSEQFDAVVMATGYRPALASLIDAPAALTTDGYPRSRSPLPGLSFIGFRDSVRGQLFEASREARRLADELSRGGQAPAPRR